MDCNRRLSAKLGDKEIIWKRSKISQAREKFPIDFPDPIEAIKFRMEQLGYNQNDLARVIGLKSRASEILNKKRKLNLEMIRSIHKQLDIPTEVLIQNYKAH
jgi:HTH-type transcriptional regulator / antitoxin HigA